MNTELSLMFHLAVDLPYTAADMDLPDRVVMLLERIRAAHMGVTALEALFNSCAGSHLGRRNEVIELMARSLACHSPEFVRVVIEAATMSLGIRESGDHASADIGEATAPVDHLVYPTENEMGEMVRKAGKALGIDVTSDSIRKTIEDVRAARDWLERKENEE